MLTLTRDTKRLTIIVIYLLLFFVLGVGAYFSFRPNPSCFDGRKNQNELGVDCGGICVAACMEKLNANDVLVREITFLPTEPGKYDIIARVFNPNNDIGASNFRYTLLLRDEAGTELARMSDSSFILPQETKLLLALNLETAVLPSKAVIELSDFQWTRRYEYRAKPELNIYSKRYVGNPDESVFGAVLGTLVNESIYDFREVRLRVVLRDADGIPLAANQSEMRTVTVDREQDIRIVFPKPFTGKVVQVDIEAEANIYDTENFLKRYTSPQKKTRGAAQPGRPAL